MESPLLAILSQLDVLGLLVLTAAGLIMAYLTMTGKVHGLFAILVFGASLTGSTNPMIDSLGSILRWIAILLLIIASLILGRLVLTTGPLLFLGYVILGFIFLFFSNLDSWQFQKAMLLIFVALAIPLAFANRSWQAYRSSLLSVAFVAALFAVYNFTYLPGHLTENVRLSGYAKGAPWFAMVLGGLLPFTLWGFWNSTSRLVRPLYGAGLLFGTVTLIFSGQRAGTLAGLLGVTPLILLNIAKKKTIAWTLLILASMSFVSYHLFQQSSSDKKQFLISRYEREAGLSNRERLWEEARSYINKNPLLGRGTGGAETVSSMGFHSTWLEVWYNTGLLGLAFYAAAQIYFLIRIYLLWRFNADLKARSVLALSLGYMLGFLVLCTFESVGAGASNVNLILYLFLGVLLSKDDLFQSVCWINQQSDVLT